MSILIKSGEKLQEKRNVMWLKDVHSVYENGIGSNDNMIVSWKSSKTIFNIPSAA